MNLGRRNSNQRMQLSLTSGEISVHGAPLFTRSDNGPEFVSQAILEWTA